jgi:hypothetical protein
MKSRRPAGILAPPPSNTSCRTLRDGCFPHQNAATKQFGDIVDEVVQQFTMRAGVKLSVLIEIQAEAKTGSDDGVRRAVKENCNVPKFRIAEFE